MQHLDLDLEQVGEMDQREVGFLDQEITTSKDTLQKQQRLEVCWSLDDQTQPQREVEIHLDLALIHHLLPTSFNHLDTGSEQDQKQRR